MKIRIVSAIILTLCFAKISILAGTPKQDAGSSDSAALEPNITLLVIVISLPNIEASKFSATHDFDSKPAEALSDLERLVAEKKAFSLANLAITTVSGRRATSESGTLILDVETQMLKGTKLVEVILNLKSGGHRIATSIKAANPSVTFLGSIQNSTDQSLTDYAFLKLSY